MTISENDHNFQDLSSGEIQILKNTMGQNLEVLLNDRSEAFALLKSDSQSNRSAALVLLKNFWQLPSEIMLPILTSAALFDSDDSVRRLAIQFIKLGFKHTYDEETSRLLASIAVSVNASNSVRESALEALKVVNSDDRQLTLEEIKLEVNKYRDRINGQFAITAEELRWAESFL